MSDNKAVRALLKERLVKVFQNLRHANAREIVHRFELWAQRIRQLLEKAQHTYFRLIIRNDETFEEVRSIKLSTMNLYVLISSLLVGCILFGVFLVAFTPLKKIVTGYKAYGSTDRAVFELTERVDSIERASLAQTRYISNFRRLLTNDVETEKNFQRDTARIPNDANLNVSPSEAELTLRAGVGGSGDEEFNDGASNTKLTASTEVGSPLGAAKKNERLESLYLSAPLSGAVLLGFSMNKQHYGIDIAAPKNTAVKATADGFIISSDWTLETGNTIVIQHENNMVSFYKHNSNNLKKVGDKVKAGEAVAIIGNTGEQTTGPHLHFEIWKDGKPVNPAEYIRF